MNTIIRRASCFILMCAAVVCVFGQASVRGRVFDRHTKSPMPYVTVSLTPNVGKTVHTVLTDANGQFNLRNLSYGHYQLRAATVGYEPYSRRVELDAERRHLHLDSLLMDEKQLAEAVVVGQKTGMRLEADRKSFDVEQQIANAGGSASDVLENIPSVEVDQDGNISLRGNSSVEVWIDGKASGLNSDNRAEILEQLPAESIERIEVIDNPSAKFSAEGSAGIINIVLKKNRRAGYYSSLGVGGNSNGGANANANVNYSSSKLDAYVNLGYRHRRNNRGGSWSRQTFTQTGEYQNYDATRRFHGNNLTARAGLTWHVSPNDHISLGGSTMFGGRKNRGTSLYHYGPATLGGDARQMFRLSESDADMRMMHGEAGYKHEFSTNHFIDFTAEYNNWRMDDSNVYRDSTTYFEPLGQPTDYSCQDRPNLVRNRSWEFKLDYENQLTDNLKLQAGYNARLSHENTPQQASIDTKNWDGSALVVDKTYFNRFIYDQDVHALYATLTVGLGKISLMGGLRGEYWKVNTESYNYAQEYDKTLRDAPFKKDYFQLFPSFFLSYQLTPTQQLQVNYTRRLRRPWGGQLNNFRNTRDASMVQFGNPQLTPEYTHSFSLNYMKSWEEHTLSLSAYYRPTTDVMQRIQYRGISDGLMYQTTMNLTKSLSSGLEIVVKNRLFTILNLTTTANFFYYHLDGFNYVIDGQNVTGLSDENFAWNVRMMGSLMIAPDFTLQLTGDYRSRQVVSQGYRKPNYSIDLGLRKTFLNKTFAVALNCRDLLDSRKWETIIHSPQFDRHQKNWRGGRNVNLTLTWNFGNLKQKPKQDKRSEDESMGIGYSDEGDMD